MSISWHSFREFKSLSQYHSKSKRKSVTRLHRQTQLIHLIFLRSRGIMVMTESELGLPNPKHRLPTQRPRCLCPDKLEQDLGSPVQTVSLAVDVWKERKLLLFWETFQARQQPARYRPTGWIPMLPPPLSQLDSLGWGLLSHTVQLRTVAATRKAVVKTDEVTPGGVPGTQNVSPTNGAEADCDDNVPCSGTTKKARKKVSHFVVLPTDLTLLEEGFAFVPFLCWAHKYFIVASGATFQQEESLPIEKVHFTRANRKRSDFFHFQQSGRCKKSWSLKVSAWASSGEKKGPRDQLHTGSLTPNRCHRHHRHARLHEPRCVKGGIPSPPLPSLPSCLTP